MRIFISQDALAAMAAGAASPYQLVRAPESKNPFPPLHLEVQMTSLGPRAIHRSNPIRNTGTPPSDFAALWILYNLYRYMTTINKDAANFSEGIFRNTGLNIDTWLHCLTFLIDPKQTFSLVFPDVDPDMFSTSEKRLQHLACMQQNVALFTNSIPHSFFQAGLRHSYRGYEVGCLLDATFNADTRFIHAMLENTIHPETLLKIEGRVFVDSIHDKQPNIVQYGSALQLALKSGNTDLIELMKFYTDRTEFERQFKSVFGYNFDAFVEKQKADAEALLSIGKNEVEAVSRAYLLYFKDKQRIYGNNPRMGDAAKFGSELEAYLSKNPLSFQSSLLKYVSENPCHNDFLLQIAYSYLTNHLITDYAFESDLECIAIQIFSVHVIGVIQASAAMTSPQRLKEYAQGMFHCIQEKEQLQDAYLLRETHDDIRHQLYLLGVSHYVNLQGRLCSITDIMPFNIFRIHGASILQDDITRRHDLMKNPNSIIEGDCAARP